MKTHKILYVLFITILAASFIACSDSSTGTTGTPGGNNGQPPDIPNLAANAQPDLSFFDSANPGSSQNYSIAALSISSGTAITAIGQVYFGFIKPASSIDPDFTNGQWVWKYSGSEGGTSFESRTTAKPQNSGFAWTNFISFNDGAGNKVDNAKIMEGSTQNKGDKGNWTFFVPDGSNKKAITSNWTVESDSKKSIDATLFNPDEGTADVAVAYRQDGVSNTMTLKFPNQDSPSVEVFWNTDTKVGYLDKGDKKLCWDGSFKNAPCSEVGL